MKGAYNQFYETDIRTWKLPQVFNARPFHEGDPDAFIVHFQGPKPQHYARYLTTGRCPFPRIPRLCELAVKNGYCDYIEDWAEHYKVGDSLDFDLPPKCSLELRLIRKLGQEVPWGK